MFNPPPHCAVNVPLIDVAVCELIWYWKLPQELSLGSCTSFETHMPIICGAPPAGVPPGVGVAVLGAVGDVTFVDVERSKLQPVTSVAATRIVPIEIGVLGILQTCRPGVRICTRHDVKIAEFKANERAQWIRLQNAGQAGRLARRSNGLSASNAARMRARAGFYARTGCSSPLK